MSGTKLYDLLAPPVCEVTEAPPPLLLKLLLLTMMALATAALAWSFLGELDIVVMGQGTLVPTGRVKVIQLAEQRIVHRILVSEGQRVKAGTPLLDFDIADVLADRDRVEKELAAAQIKATRLRAQLAAGPAFEPPAGADPARVADERALFTAERLRLEGEVATLRRDRERASAAREQIAATIDKLDAILPLIRQRVEARRTLVDRQYASATDFLTLRQELVTAEGESRIQRAALAEAETAVAAGNERIAQAERTARRDWTAELVETEGRAALLAEERVKARQRLAALDLRAPEDGTIHELSLHTVGAVVQAAQPLMKLVPEGAVLEVEATLLNRDVGFVTAGQSVQVKLDAFPFTKYGGVSGRVAAVSSDAVADERLGPVYKARVSLDRAVIGIHGKDVPLTPGLTATVDILTGQRRVIDYLLMPVFKATQEAMRER